MFSTRTQRAIVAQLTRMLILAGTLVLAEPAALGVHLEELVTVAPGVRLRVLARGASDALPVLLYTPFAWTFPAIHSGDHVFLPLATDFIMLTYDPRGVGGSEGGRAASFDDYVTDVAALAAYACRRFNKSAIYASGTSSGATIVAHAAHLYPERFAHILLNGPSLNFTRQLETSFWGIEDVWGIPAPVARKLPTVVSGVLVMLRIPFQDCRTRLFCRMEFFTPLTFAGSRYYRWGAAVFFQAALAFAELMDLPGTLTYDLTALRAFDVPVTVLSGEHDRYMANVNDTAAWAASLATPQTRHVIVPGASHALHIEENAAYCDVVRRIREPRDACSA